MTVKKFFLEKHKLFYKIQYLWYIVGIKIIITVVIMLNYKKDFKDILKNLRTKNDISRKDLARAVNVSPSMIAKYEQGINYPSGEVLFSLKEFFQVPADTFLNQEKENKKDIMDFLNKNFNFGNEISFINMLLNYYDIGVQFNSDESLNLGSVEKFYSLLKVNELNKEIKNLILDRLIMAVLDLYFINDGEPLELLNNLYSKKRK